MDGFQPSQKMMAGVLRQLANAGVPIDLVPRDWAEAILAGAVKWLVNTPGGLEEITALLKLQAYRGNSENSYFVTDENETKSSEVSPDDITFVRGVFAQGEAIPFERLSMSPKERQQCDDCGVVAHCLVDVRDPSTDKIKSLCNGCITLHENPRIKDLGGRDICQRCSSLTCPHHPNRSTVRQRSYS